MKLKRVFCGPEGKEEPYGWMHWCPACRRPHVFAVERPSTSPSAARWSFDGNVEKPTFSPSMLIYVDMEPLPFWLIKRRGEKRGQGRGWSHQEALGEAQRLAEAGEPGWVPVRRESASSGTRRTICHYHLQKGMLSYCSDSPHALAGKSVPLPDLPKEYSGRSD